MYRELDAVHKLAVWNDVDGIRKFIAERVVQQPSDKRTLDERVAGFSDMRSGLGALKIVAVMASSKTQLTLSMHSEAQGELTLAFELEPSEPYRIVSLRVEQ